ncbi:hypothetical protein ACWCQR_21980, partial [Streptomyces sp. NPDC002172]
TRAAAPGSVTGRPAPGSSVLHEADGRGSVAAGTTTRRADCTRRRLVSASARLVVVVADHTKWGTVGLSSFAKLEQIDTLVTDAGLPSDARAEISEHLRRLVVAGEAEA